MSEQLRHIGYISTSPNDQNPGMQANTLNKTGSGYIYQPTVSENPLAQETRQELMDLPGGCEESLSYRLNCSARDEYIRVKLQQQPQVRGVTIVVISNQKEAGERNEK